jgi:S1-C subfamily serine protease
MRSLLVLLALVVPLGAMQGQAPKLPEIGFDVRDVTDDDVYVLGLDDEQGALVDFVEPGSPADRAGVHATDVIIQLDRRPVLNAAEFNRRLKGVKAGETVELLVIRHGREERFRVNLQP